MKGKTLILLLISLFLVTGCEKKLTCTLEEEGQKSTLIYRFKDDKATKVTMKVRIELDENIDDKKIDERIKTFKEYYESNGYEDVEVKAKGKRLDVTATTDAKKFTSSNDEKDLTYDAIKKVLEDGEYTCK